MIFSTSRSFISRVVKSFMLVCVLTLGQAYAQDPGDTDIGDPDVPPGIPVDGGIGFLLAAGAIVGVRKIYKDKKGQKDSEVGYHSKEQV